MLITDRLPIATGMAVTSTAVCQLFEAYIEGYTMEVLIATAGTFASKMQLEHGNGYMLRPPTAFDGEHGYPMAYKRPVVLKDWIWDRDAKEQPDWWDKAINIHPGNKRGEYSYLYADVRAEAWFVEIDMPDILKLLKLQTDYRLAWSDSLQTYALCERKERPEDIVTETNWGVWSNEWLEEQP